MLSLNSYTSQVFTVLTAPRNISVEEKAQLTIAQLQMTKTVFLRHAFPMHYILLRDHVISSFVQKFFDVRLITRSYIMELCSLEVHEMLILCIN